jgi:hypothetical protein
MWIKQIGFKPLGDEEMPMTRAKREAARTFGARALLLGLLIVAFPACSSMFGNSASKDDHTYDYKTTPTPAGPGLTLFGHSDSATTTASGSVATAGTGVSVGVNSYLWRASLDTISFMPLASADPFGGVIITDWYAPASSPTERFKVTVYILDKQLRADALKVSVFRQQRGSNGEWTAAALDPETPSKLENAILTRARQLRIASSEK